MASLDASAILAAKQFGVTTGFGAPCRLPASTRALAARYISGEIGEALEPSTARIAPDFFRQGPTHDQIVAEAVRLIAEEAPLRLLPGEHLVGAATLVEATWHQIPVIGVGSISHTTLDFEKALRVGLAGLQAEIDAVLAQGALDGEGHNVLRSMRGCVEAMRVWHGRYVRALEARIAGCAGEEQAHWDRVLSAMRPVPERAPTTFHEALQALWFLWNFQRLCGNWSGVGRFDKMLGPFLEADLAAGRLTLDEARDLVAHFWIKGCEWITRAGRGNGTGDAQFYQNIVLAGVDDEGGEVANAVTDLVLDVVEELHISDFPIAVRLSPRTPERLLRRIAAVQRLGGGIIAVYNEERIIDNMVRFGYPLAEARNFANDGCWEVLVPGKTRFGYQPFDTLRLLQETLGLGPSNHEPADFPDFEGLFDAFTLRLARQVTDLLNATSFAKHINPLVSLLVEDCISRGRGYEDGGPRYTVLSPHAGGIPDTADSLLVIRQLVYEERRLTLREFVEILQADWDGHEDLRRSIRARFEFWGNDVDASDTLVRRVYDAYTDFVAQVHDRYGVWRPAGISTFGREVSDFRPQRAATASGHHKGDILAPNFSPSPGSDLHGPTAAIRSHCAVDLGKLPCGTALDLKILPSTLRGEAGIQALVSLMRAFVELGGIFMQLDVVDSALLRDAQAHPENYPNLSVRVSGWSARFTTLCREWQEMIIARTEQRMG
jgi:pyruvate-formate lyase